LELARKGILILFLSLEEKLSLFTVEYDVSCGFVICGTQLKCAETFIAVNAYIRKEKQVGFIPGMQR